MDLGLQGKTAVVTGASKGIGYAAAETFLKEGAKVAVCFRHEDELKEATQVLSGLGEVYYRAFDVSSAVEDYASAEHVHDHFEGLDVQANDIGATGYKKDEEYNSREIDFMTGVCFESVVCDYQAAFRYMKEQKKGVIINVSSLTVRCSSARRGTLYRPSGSTVNNLTNTSAGEYCVHNVRVAYIIPGFTVTPLVKKTISQGELNRNASSTLLRRVAGPEGIAKPIIFLASDTANYMTAVTVEVFGGRNMTPNPTCAYDRLEAE